LPVNKELPPVPPGSPAVIPPPHTTGTPVDNNASIVRVIPPPRVICNCPMEPVVSRTVAPTPTPDDGLCHCP
jgi:hypothetical protein